MPRPLHEVIKNQDEIADWFEAEGPSPDNTIPVSEYFLGLLADVQNLDADKVCGAVELARHAGATWQQIGDVLGVPGSKAEQRFDSAATRPTTPRREAESLGFEL